MANIIASLRDKIGSQIIDKIVDFIYAEKVDGKYFASRIKSITDLETEFGVCIPICLRAAVRENLGLH